MKRDMIFFSPEGLGLTSTSANHLANLAKEMIRCEEAELAGLRLYSSSVALIGTKTSERLSTGATAAQLEKATEKLYTIAKAKSLIAWLREAIKAKERLYKEAEAMTLKEYAEAKGFDLPELPTKKESLTEDEYYASLSIDERNRFYQTETLAAVLGNAIHPGGSLATAREDLDCHIRKPRDIRGEGRDALIYSYEPTIEQSLIDEIYFRLQKQYREAQAKVNSFKYDCNKAVTESQTANNATYVKEMADYNNKMKLLNAELEAHIKNRTAEIENYRIMIPQSLSSIFELVSDLGKKK